MAEQGQDTTEASTQGASLTAPSSCATHTTPAWERAAAELRRITTVVVAIVAACALVLGANLPQNAGTTDEQSQTESATDEQSAGNAPEAQSFSIETARATQEDEVRTTQARRANLVDLPAAQDASGAYLTQGYVLVDAGNSNGGSGKELATTLGTTQELLALQQAINGFESQGYALSFTLVDLGTGRSLAYRPDDYYYSASSIKGPFTVSGYEYDVDTGLADPSVVDPLAERILVESDNDAYLALRDTLGAANFKAWLADADVSAGAYPTLSDLADTHYPRLNTNQMAEMWVSMYSYLSSGSESAQKLVSYMQRREVSPIKAAVGDTYDTWSKAGWIDVYADGGVEPATWDAGVVFAPSGTYVVAIASNAPSEFTAVQQVADAMDAAHDALVR